MWLEVLVRRQGRKILQALKDGWIHGGPAEEAWLHHHVAANARTIYGTTLSFGRIRSWADYRDAVPLRPVEAFSPLLDEIRDGSDEVLTSERTTWLSSHAGSAWVPMTETSVDRGRLLMAAWLADVEGSCPGALAGALALVPDGPPGQLHRRRHAAIREHRVPGIAAPCLPWLVRRRLAVPERVSRVLDPELRGYLTARFALGRDVSALAASSAQALIALGRTIQVHAASLIRAIHDGTLGVFACEQPRLFQALAWRLAPDPARARALERAAGAVGHLRAADAWPGLKLLACPRAAGPAPATWPWFGDRPLVDLGQFVGAERVTLPLGELNGLAAIATSGYAELLPEGAPPSGLEAVRTEAAVPGQRYQVVLTSAGGLYRALTGLWVRVDGRAGGALVVEPCAPPAARPAVVQRLKVGEHRSPPR